MCNIIKCLQYSRKIPSDYIYFLPDKLMGQNLQRELARRNVKKPLNIGKEHVMFMKNINLR